MQRLIFPFILIAFISYGCSDTATPASPSAVEPYVASVVVPDQADHGGRSLSAELVGNTVVPGPGDPDGSGALMLSVNTGQREFCYVLHTENIDTVTAVHLHEGVAGVSGENVFTLLLPWGGYSTDCVDGLNRTFVRQVRHQPDAFYIVVHTEAYPDGAIRGQLAVQHRAYP